MKQILNITLYVPEQIGFNEMITFTYNSKNYKAKMYSKAKGRIDRLSAFYKENNIKLGDTLRLTYHFKEKRVLCEKI